MKEIDCMMRCERCRPCRDLFVVVFLQEDEMATVTDAKGRTHYVYTISGVKVEFPAKAYPSQIAMMDKVRCHADFSRLSPLFRLVSFGDLGVLLGGSWRDLRVL